MEAELSKRMRAFLHVDDERRATAYARMLFFSIWRDGDGAASYDEGLVRLRGEPRLCEEIRQIVEYGAERPRRVAKPLRKLGYRAPLPHPRP